MDELIAFRGENSSHAFHTNLLLKEKKNYLMDNHRMALWCWTQEIDVNKSYTIIHIDKHYDTLGNQVEVWAKEIKKDLKDMSVNEYDKLEYEVNAYEMYPVFRWDNNMPLFQYLYPENVKEYLFFTQKNGTIWEGMRNKITHYSAFNLVNDFHDYFEDLKDNIIVNLDIDYFFNNSIKKFVIFSDEAIQRIFRIISDIMRNQNNILTVALSPECCGGWKNSKDFINKFGPELGIGRISI